VGEDDVDDSHTLITTREMDAPVKRVWEAWNDPEQIARWWGPAGFPSTVQELDVRKGGRFDVVMHGPDGTDYPNLYVFDHVEELGQLVYKGAGSEQFGGGTHPSRSTQVFVILPSTRLGL
jgi:uncharacterized protein YndB with AHSA1/START domain